MQNLPLEMELDAIHSFYEENQNPLLLWEALKLCLDEKYSVPDWVSDYFSAVASEFFKLSDIAKRRSFDKRVEIEVYKALGMSEAGAYNVFSKYSNLKRDKDIIRDYYQLVQVSEVGKADDKTGHVNAVEAVAEKWKVSESLVNKLIYSSREKMGNLPENYEFELKEKRKKRVKNKALRKKKALEKQKLQT
jgi:hypothetical protein